MKSCLQWDQEGLEGKEVEPIRAGNLFKKRFHNRKREMGGIWIGDMRSRKVCISMFCFALFVFHHVCTLMGTIQYRRRNLVVQEGDGPLQEVRGEVFQGRI